MTEDALFKAVATYVCVRRTPPCDSVGTILTRLPKNANREEMRMMIHRQIEAITVVGTSKRNKLTQKVKSNFCTAVVR